MKRCFFAPGRTELAGYHTDHQNGRVLAAAVDVGITAEVIENADSRIRIVSDGFAPFSVQLDDLAPRPAEFGMPQALVRGVVSALRAAGGAVCGFDARVTSALKPGGGLSSSAAFEILIGRILNTICNGGAFDARTLAAFGQTAENDYFGKPSGLMDQLACAMDGAVYIDFQTGEVQRLNANFAALGLTLCLTDTGGSHAGLTAAYAEIPADMRRVAAQFGAEQLTDVLPERFFAHRKPGRAFDRAAHFFTENERVPQMRNALLFGDAESYLRLMNESGRSSETLLRNICTPEGDDRLERGLALSAQLLEGVGAWRVHGGGFAGCVQALVPVERFFAYQAAMDAAFGHGACRAYRIASAQPERSYPKAKGTGLRRAERPS